MQGVNKDKSEDPTEKGLTKAIGDTSKMCSRMSVDMGSFGSVLKEGSGMLVGIGSFESLSTKVSEMSVCLAGYGVSSKVGHDETGY